MATNTLPKGWSWATLGALADFVNGDRGGHYPAPSDRVAAGVPFINTGHILPSGRLTGAGMDYITRESFERLRSGKVKPGDILYCLRGSTIGKTARNHLAEGAIASSLVIVRANGRASQEYLYYYLTSPWGQRLAAQHDNGSAQPNLSVRSLSSFPVPLPPPGEQRAIAGFLGVLDDKIELNRGMSETLQAMAHAVFKSWFVDFDPVCDRADGRDSSMSDPIRHAFPDRFEDSGTWRLPKGWRISKLGDVAVTSLGGTPARDEPRYWGGEIPWINSGKANEFRVVAPSELITHEGLASSSTKLLPPRTTIIAITGSTLGQVSLTEIATCANQSLVGVLGNESVPSEFIYFWVRERISDLVASQTGGAQQHINKDDVKALPIVCPDAAVMAAFADVSRPIFDRIRAGVFEALRLAQCRALLLPKLVSGQIRVRHAEEMEGLPA